MFILEITILQMSNIKIQFLYLFVDLIYIFNSNVKRIFSKQLLECFFRVFLRIPFSQSVDDDKSISIRRNWSPCIRVETLPQLVIHKKIKRFGIPKKNINALIAKLLFFFVFRSGCKWDSGSWGRIGWVEGANATWY